MIIKIKQLVVAGAAFVAATFVTLFVSPSSAAADRMVTIGTGGVTGVYYPGGGAICRLVNRGRKEHGIHCTVDSTGGSIFNLQAIANGELTLGIVQSDLLFSASHGTEPFRKLGANPHLRALFSLHSEPFTVVVRKDSRIRKFDDLKGKRVNIGNQGSGMRATMEELMRLKGWSKDSFDSAPDLKLTDQADALCKHKIDAMVFAAGHPNGAIQQVTAACETRIIDVSGPDIDRLIQDNPYYAHTVIPGGMYVGNPGDVHTFGVKAILAATDDVDSETAYQVVHDVFENLDNFKTLHPVFATLNPVSMVRDVGDVAPLHEGARRYFREKGLR